MRGAARLTSRAQQRPPQVGVDAEPVEPHRTVQQPGQQRQVLAGRGDARERPEVGQLGIRAGFRREEQVAQRARRQRQPRLPPARVGEPARRRARLTQQRLHDADVAHRGDTRQHQPHVVARRHLPVAAHVPGRRPAQRRGQRVGERADRVHQRAQRMLIQPDLGVAEVVVVDQHQVGARLPGQLGDHRARPGHVGLDPQPARQPVGGPVVQADGDPVRAQQRMAGRGLLLHRELGEPAVGVHRVGRPQRVHPGRLQPVLRPRGQVPARGLLQRGQQVGQRRVAPRVRAEVLPHAVQEVLPPDVRHQLLEHGRALGVGDPVEIDLHGLDVRDVGRDRMGGRQLVLAVGPGLVQLRERGPGGRPARRLGLRERARPGGERLVQPQVVPPAHRHQVAEPHVRHLVQDGLAASFPGEIGDPGPENI